MRELTRYRRSLTRSLTGERSRAANRIQKLLEGANVKLGSVASNVLGASGRAMLQAMCEGEEDPKVLAELARGRLRGKLEELEEALGGLMGPHQRYLLASQLRHLRHLEEEVGRLDQEVARRVDPFEETVAAVDTIPGIGRRTAEVIVAEMGTDMTQFPTPGHLASWAGVCPGNNRERRQEQAQPHPEGQQLAEARLGGSGQGGLPNQDLPGGQVPSPGPAHRGQPGGDGGGPLHHRHPPPGDQDRETLRRPGPKLLRGTGPGRHHPPLRPPTPTPRHKVTLEAA